MYIVLLICLYVSVALSADTHKATRDIIVKWRAEPLSLDAATLLPLDADKVEYCAQAVPVSKWEGSGLERISVITLKESESIASLLSTLNSDPRVEYAERRPIRYLDNGPEPNHRSQGSLDGIPDDPYYPQQWYLPVIQAEAAWDITDGSSDVAIAVVDQGVDFTHPDLTESRWNNTTEINGLTGVDDDNNGYVDDFHGWNFMDMKGDPQPFDPDRMHGTHVAGTIAATRNNGRGIAGIAPHCKIMGIRAGDGNIYYGYEGIYYACKSGAKIINCSWGGTGESPFEHDILNYVRSQGCVVVASAGNQTSQAPHYPAAIEGVLSVAASDAGDYAADYTNYGNWVKISAPGVNILSTATVVNGVPRYFAWQGTSMAAPMVSAICGLVASRFPTMSGQQIMSRVVSSSDPIDQINSPDRAGTLGLGRVNAWRSLSDEVAGVRLGGISFSEILGNRDGHLQAGESAELRISVYNDLVPVTGVTAEISTTADSVSLSNTVSFYGDLPSGGPYWNNQPAFVIALPSTSSRVRYLPLTIDWRNATGRLIGRAKQMVYLDSSFIAFNNGYLTLGFADNGSLGYHDYLNNVYMGSGLRVEGHPTNALYHGSFMLAHNGIVLDNFYSRIGGQRVVDWRIPEDSIIHRIPSSRSDLEARTFFDDSQAVSPIFARVQASVLGWNDPENNHFLILEYVVTNPTGARWDSVYAGLMLDWSLSEGDNNSGGLDPVGDLAFVQQPLPGIPMVAAASVSDPWTVFYQQRFDSISDATWNDSDKWRLLQEGIHPSTSTPMDLFHVTAVGPFSVDAHSTYTVAFALVAGESLDDLRLQATRARQHFTPQTRQLPAGQKNTDVKIAFYPNPVPSGQDLKLQLPSGNPASIRIYNLLGQLVTEFTELHPQAGGITIQRDRLNGASGLLFYRVESESVTAVGKLLLLK